MALIEKTAGERGSALLRFLDRYPGIPLAFLAAVLRRLLRRQPSVAEPHKIGIICLGAVGDLLLLSALTDGLRRKFPDARIEIIGSGANSSALALNPHADAVYSAPVRRFLLLLAHIRRQRYDILIDSSQWARLGNLLCNLSGAGLTSGFDTPGQYRSAGYDRICLHRSDCHELENFIGLGRALWPDLTGAPCLRIPATCAEKERIIHFHMWPAKGRGRHLKLWPASCWAALAATLMRSGFGIRLTGGREDAEANETFLARFFPRSDQIESIAGRMTWQELAAAFAKASAVVSVNTGTMHLAAICGVPTIGLHGATDPKRWGPAGPNTLSLLPHRGKFAYLDLGFEYPHDAKPAMQYLPVRDVLAALAELWLRRR